MGNTHTNQNQALDTAERPWALHNQTVPFSSGEFPNPDGFPVVDARDECNYPPLPGSRQLFSFRGLNMDGRDDPNVKKLSNGFVSCFCSAYLEGESDHEERCPFRHIAGSRYFKSLDPIVARGRRRRQRTRRAQVDSDSDDE